MGQTVLISNFGALGAQVKAAVMPVVQQTAMNVLADAVKSMSGDKTGRFYRLPGPAGLRKKTVGQKAAADFEALGLERVSGKAGGAGRFIVGSNIYRASAPDETPAIPTGALKATGIVVPIDDLTQAVEFGTAYALTMEEGSVDGKTAPRPFLRPAVSRATSGYGNAVAAAINRAAIRATVTGRQVAG